MAARSGISEVENLPVQIGRYQPLEILGRGGQGMVYLARDPELERQVALKTLHKRASDPAKLLNEARNVAQLDHPNIVSLFEIDLEFDPPYLVYQLAPGRPLSNSIGARQLLPVEKIARLMIDVLDAISNAHKNNVLHRDITPANILLDDSNSPHILDFGISIGIADSTGKQDLAGTVNYMAPELLSDEPPSARSDLFSVAVVMHELLTGRRLFEADNTMAVIYKILNERIVPPSVDRKELDSELEQIVMRGLARDPNDRYQSAAAMRDALKDYLTPKEAADDTSSDGGDVRGAIQFMQRRMSRKPDFPAVSQHISEINQKSGIKDGSDANELASVILKDYALTTKVLKIVNSAVYGQYGSTITTVSRAVVILGFEAVRAIALGIVVFEHLKNGQQAELLKNAALASFLSAILGKELNELSGQTGEDEEVFIGAMFHRLGRHLAIYYFPEEFDEVLALMASKGIDEQKAAHTVFGASLSEFGMAIGREWRLPERLIGAMRPSPAGELKPAENAETRIAQFSAMSNAIADVVSSEDENVGEQLDDILERYKSCIEIDRKNLQSVVQDALSQTREFASIISNDLQSTPFFGKVERAVAEPGVDAENSHLTADRAEPLADPTPAASSPENDTSGNKQLFLTNAIADITTAIIERAPVNDMFVMVLEAIYRALAFSHVLLLVRDPRSQGFTTRFGFGDSVDSMKQEFSFRIDATEDIFSLAVRKGRNAVIVDTADEKYAHLVPAWVREMNAPKSILVFSIVVNKKCIGLIYADSCESPVSINAQLLKLLNTLVKQLTLGIQQR